MKFSIITCTYNSEKYILDNINSVRNQTFQDFEHIFIDGFSNDKTVEIIKRYQREFPEKVKFFQYPANGIGNAMNKGIKHATGEYINHMHSDDSFYDNFVLENVAEFIEKNNNPNWIYGKANFVNIEKGKSMVIPHRKIYQKIRFWLLLLTNYIPHQAVFIKKYVFDKFGKFDENYKSAMDYELWIRLSKNNVPSLFFNQIICNFSVRNDSQSTLGRFGNESPRIFQKYIKSKSLIKILTLIHRLNRQRDLL